MSKIAINRERGRTAGKGRLLPMLLTLAVIPLLSGCLFVKPDPISDAEHWERTLDDRSSLYWEQEHPTAPITLPEAVARAIKYNLDHRLALMEDAFQMNQLEVANLGMLPRLALNAGYSWRSNESASDSIGYYDRQESLRPSVSSDVWRWTTDLSFNWSLLDFGLSYFQAKQQADRFMIVKERRRRLVNNLIKDVISEYFRVASAEVVGKQVEETLQKAEEALQAYQKIEAGKKGSPAQALEQQRALINIISNLRMVSLQLASAKSRLAALMNLPLSSQFTIVPPGEGEMKPPQLSAQLADLETIGIYLRPDLREETYQARIDQVEVKKDILRMIPMLNTFTSRQFDSNQYLVHQAWGEAGMRLTQDLLGMAQKWKQVKASKAQIFVSRQRRLAATVAAMVQINLGYYQYRQAVELYQDSERLKDIDSRLLELSQAASKAREIGELERIRQTAVALNTQLDRDRSLIEVLSAWGNLYFSVGGDILGNLQGTEDLATLTCVVAESIGRWLVGELPELPGDAPSLPGGSMAGGRYSPRAPLPPVLSVSEDIKRMAEEKAEREKAAAEKKKAEEEKKGKGRKGSEKPGKSAAEAERPGDGRPARPRPERDAILKEREERKARGGAAGAEKGGKAEPEAGAEAKTPRPVRPPAASPSPPGKAKAPPEEGEAAKPARKESESQGRQPEKTPGKQIEKQPERQLEKQVDKQSGKQAENLDQAAAKPAGKSVDDKKSAAAPQSAKLKRSPEDIMRELEESLGEVGGPAEADRDSAGEAVVGVGGDAAKRNAAVVPARSVSPRTKTPKVREFGAGNPKAEILQSK